MFCGQGTGGGLALASGRQTLDGHAGAGARCDFGIHSMEKRMLCGTSGRESVQLSCVEVLLPSGASQPRRKDHGEESKEGEEGEEGKEEEVDRVARARMPEPNFMGNPFPATLIRTGRGFTGPAADSP